MVKRSVLVLLTLLLSTSSPQQWISSLTMSSYYPVPTISSWENNPGIATLTITNTGTESKEVVIFLKVTKKSVGEILSASSKTILFAAGESQVFQTMDYLDWNSIKYNASFKNIIVQTGNLPEGDYTTCAEVKQVNTMLSQSCADFAIILAGSPALSLPTHMSVINTTMPVLQWWQVEVPPPLLVDYKFKLCEMLPGQTPLKAVQSNQPVYETVLTSQTILQYPPEALPLEEGKQYAWQVQAVSGSGSPSVVQFKTDGKSEVWSFKIFKEEKTVELVSPADNSTLSATQVSQYSKAFKFTWTTINLKKTITNFWLKIAEILPGQNAESALNNNPPVFFKNDILPTQPMYWITEEEGSLINQKQYAWRVWLYSEPWGGLIDSSSIWKFTVQSSVEFIPLLSPVDNADFEADTLHSQSHSRTYLFSWDNSKLVKSITNFRLKIAEINEGQTPARALKENPYVFYNDKIPPSWSSYILPEETGKLKDKQRYAWQVTTYSQAYNGLTASSEAESFTIKNGVTLIDSINYFIIGQYKVNLLSITNKNANYFGGKGEVLLWHGGPKIQFDFHGLKLQQVISTGQIPEWKVNEGEIWTSITPTNISLQLTIPGSSFLKATAIRLEPDRATLLGSINFKSSLLVKNLGSSANLVMESGEIWFNVDPVHKITVGQNQHAYPKTDYNFFMLTPLNFNLNIGRTQSEFLVNANKLTLKLQGELLLPVSVKNSNGQRIALRFYNKNDFKFLLDVATNDLINIKLVSNYDVRCRFIEANVDLYAGLVGIKQGEIFFDQAKMTYPPIALDDKDNFRIIATGLHGYIHKNNLNLEGSYRGYAFNIKRFSLNYENNILKNSIFRNSGNFLKGKIFIPFIKKEADITYNITSNGFSNGIVSLDGISNWIAISGGQPGDKSTLKLQIVTISYLAGINCFWLNGYFKFDCTGTDGLTTEKLPVSNVFIDSTGSVSAFGSDPEGWINLSVTKPGKYNGFPIMLDKFRIKTYANYAFGIAGTIVVAEDLSSQNGSPFDASIVVARYSLGKSGTEVPNSEVEVEPIGVDFGNGETSFGAQLIVFNDDPVYGKGFLASFNLTMHDPTEFSAFSKIIIGKTDNGNGFSYWFVEAGAIFPVAITTVMDIGIRGFTGRVYSHMKHKGDGILGSDYVPDKNNTFGVYAMCPIQSVSDDGSKFWGKVALEIRVGNGFQSTLYGEIYVLSSGFMKEDAKIKGTATIFISTNPKIFDSQCTIEANFWDGLCGDGEMQMHISESEWYLHIGTPEKPITLRMFCTAQGFYGYFTIDQNYMTTAAGFTFDTGPQKWGAGLGFYGKAAGSIRMSSTIYYKPLQFVSTASMSASGEIGVYVDVKFFTGYLSLLSGEMNAVMQVMFPDPVCFAGKVDAKACIKVCVIGCKLCRSASFKIRYKNGSFALKDECSS
ncbi:MAG: hypothetical protein C4539_16680 [Ignavibacteriales bacterium]|nr:MAG: hypothetical protein C4539_16680 [Ignavibacteriales bacterium]